MSVAFVSYFTATDPAKVQEYLGYMRLGKKALALTNPGARYVVITDGETARHLAPHVEVFVVEAPKMGFMRASMWSQSEFLRLAQDDLTILAAPDCIANRRLDEATAPNMGLAITYRRPPNTINNVAYVRDNKKACWFLERAMKALDAYPADQTIWLNHGWHNIHDWGGDQDSWRDALGEFYSVESDKGIKIAVPDGELVFLVPCETHNHFIRRTGGPKAGTFKAYILHFKGPRKAHMPVFVEQYLPDWLAKRKEAGCE